MISLPSKTPIEWGHIVREGCVAHFCACLESERHIWSACVDCGPTHTSVMLLTFATFVATHSERVRVQKHFSAPRVGLLKLCVCFPCSRYHKDHLHILKQVRFAVCVSVLSRSFHSYVVVVFSSDMNSERRRIECVCENSEGGGR